MIRIQYPYVTVATYFLDVDHGTEYQSGLFDATYVREARRYGLLGLCGGAVAHLTPVSMSTRRA